VPLAHVLGCLVSGVTGKPNDVIKDGVLRGSGINLDCWLSISLRGHWGEMSSANVDTANEDHKSHRRSFSEVPNLLFLEGYRGSYLSR
jgi:hypothetical protein